jgi:hypothetical protein
MARTPAATRKTIGLGFVSEESRHGVLIHIPKGSAKGDMISISEYRGDRFSGAEVTALPAPPPSDPALRVSLDRGRWAAQRKELCVLCWAVEEASIDDIPNALRNWEALAPEERCWLYTMTMATTGQAMKKGIGWRKARRELLGHSQLALEI